MSRATDTLRLWRDRVGDQQRSDLSVASYCAEHAVSESTFYLWRRRLGKARPPTPMKLVEVITTPSSTSPATASLGMIEIVLPDALIVRVDGHVPHARMREVIAALRDVGSSGACS